MQTLITAVAVFLNGREIKYYRKSFEFQGAIKWNGLPKDIKELTIFEHSI